MASPGRSHHVATSSTPTSIASSTQSLRILVVGENSVGKSLFVNIITSFFESHNGVPSLPGTRLLPTIGFRIEACAWARAPVYHRSSNLQPNSSSSHSRTGSTSGGGFFGAGQQQPPVPPQQQQHQGVVLEFMDIGGSRSFSAASRAPCYSNIDGIIMMYNSESAASAVALHYWRQELQLQPGLEKKPFMLVGSVLRGRGGGDNAHGRGGPLGSPTSLYSGGGGSQRWGRQQQQSNTFFSVLLDIVQDPESVTTRAAFISAAQQKQSSPLGGGGGGDSITFQQQQQPSMSTGGTAGGGPSKAALALIQAFGLGAAFWTMWQRVLMLLMSLMLFGFNQTIVPLSFPSAKQVLEELRSDQYCIGELSACSLKDVSTLTDEMEELVHFFTAVAADAASQ